MSKARQNRSAKETNKNIPRKARGRLEWVECPYCRNGTRANKKMCTLCEGEGRIQALP